VLYKKWCLRLFLLIFAMSFGVAAFNFIVDPYDIYPTPDIPGVTSNKYYAKNMDWKYKPYQFERNQPNQVIFGSSRSEIALDPEHPAWDSTQGRVYNFAFSGANITEIAARFKSAHQSHPFKKALLGIDFFGFSAYSPNRVATTSRLNDIFCSLFTANALKVSQKTLKKQDSKKYPGLLPNGQIAWNAYSRPIEIFGQRKFFIETEKHAVEGYLPKGHPSYSFTNTATDADTIQIFSDILAFSRANEIELTVFVPPPHLRILELIWLSGLWPKVGEWKRAVVDALAKEAAQSDQPPFEFWDFSGINPVTSEEVPAPGDMSSRIQYYWEASHSKKETGDLMLEVLLGKRHPVYDPASFGVLLTPNNIDDYLLQTDARFEDYRDNHAGELEEIAKTIARHNSGT